MNADTKKRPCKSCGKLLINEEKAICKRCDLKKKRKQMTIGSGIVGSCFIIIAIFRKALAGNKGSKHDTKTV